MMTQVQDRDEANANIVIFEDFATNMRVIASCGESLAPVFMLFVILQ